MPSTSVRTVERLESNAPDLTLSASCAWRMTCGPWMGGTTSEGLVATPPPPVLWSGTLLTGAPLVSAWLDPYFAGTGPDPPAVDPPPPQAAAAVRTPTNKARTTSNRFMRPPPDLMQTKRGRVAKVTSRVVLQVRNLAIDVA